MWNEKKSKSTKCIYIREHIPRTLTTFRQTSEKQTHSASTRYLVSNVMIIWKFGVFLFLAVFGPLHRAISNNKINPFHLLLCRSVPSFDFIQSHFILSGVFVNAFWSLLYFFLACKKWKYGEKEQQQKKNVIEVERTGNVTFIDSLFGLSSNGCATFVNT